MIARVRNTANIAISSFNYLLVKHVMCHVHILDFLKERRITASKTPVQRTVVCIFGVGEQRNRKPA